MSGVVAVRDRRPDDLPALGRLLRAVHERDGYPVEGVDDPQAWLSPPTLWHSWVATHDDRVIGHVLVIGAGESDAAQLWTTAHHQQQDRVATLARLFVVSEGRGRGAGRALVEAAMVRSQREGWPLVLDVLDKDQRAVALYERLGWRRLGSITHRFAGQEWPATAYEAPAPAR